MNEAYAEWLVKRKTPAYAVLLKAVMVALCVIAAFLAITPILGIIGMVILLVVIGATYLVFRNSEVEFEYLYVTKQLSIDRIYGRAKRKKAWEANMDEIKIIAPTGSYLLKDHETRDMKNLDFSSQRPDAKTYTLISQSGAVTTRIVFEPNEKMLHCLKMSAPRKVIES